jgi:hypothetical protein
VPSKKTSFIFGAPRLGGSIHVAAVPTRSCDDGPHGCAVKLQSALIGNVSMMKLRTASRLEGVMPPRYVRYRTVGPADISAL